MPIRHCVRNPVNLVRHEPGVGAGDEVFIYGQNGNVGRLVGRVRTPVADRRLDEPIPAPFHVAPDVNQIVAVPHPADGLDDVYGGDEVIKVPPVLDPAQEEAGPLRVRLPPRGATTEEDDARRDFGRDHPEPALGAASPMK
jgi:hypothetical protein